MAKWMFLITHAEDIVNPRIVEILKSLKDSLDKEGKELEVQDRPYILILVCADTYDKNGEYLSFNKNLRTLYELSQKYQFNYKILYKGKQYYNKLDLVPLNELLTKIVREINFVKPTWIMRDFYCTYNQNNTDAFYLRDLSLYLKNNTQVYQNTIIPEYYMDIYYDIKDMAKNAKMKDQELEEIL